MANVNAIQKGKLVGKLKSIKRGKVSTFDSGTEYVDYTTAFTLPNGVYLRNRKRLFNPNSPTEYTQRVLNELEAMIEQLETATVNGDVLFVEKRIAPSKDKEDATKLANSFNSFTSFVRDDGTIGYVCEGDITIIDGDRVDPVPDEEGNIIDYAIT